MLSFVCFSSEGESEKKPRLFCVGCTSFDVPEYSIAGITPLIQKILFFERDRIMSLLQEWREAAYSLDINSKEGQAFWNNYFVIEKGIYEKLLSAPEMVEEGTVKQLAEKYETPLQIMVGFLDGINESLVTPNPIEEMTEDTKVSLAWDKEKLYYNMVGADASWLYELPQWDNLLTPERRKELYLEQKKSGTVVKDKKIGRNDPCPCGSGKKYKKCCGA